MPTSNDESPTPEATGHGPAFPANPGHEDPAAGLPVYQQVTGPGRSRIQVGSGIPKAPEDLDIPSDDEPLQQPAPVINYRRADGSHYDNPPGKTVLDNPQSNIVIEVDESGEEKLDGIPRFKDQLTNPLWRSTWIEGPPKYEQFNLGDPEQAKAFDRLCEESHPLGAAFVVVTGIREVFDEQSGNFKVLVKYRRIRYKKIISIK
jgi:hypothetical protein